MTNESKTRACWQPWESLNIGADGKVYPCCVVHPDLEVGSLATTSLEEIIAGKPMLSLKRRLLAGDIATLPCSECCNAPLTDCSDFKQAIRDRFFSPSNIAVVAPAEDSEPPSLSAALKNETSVAARATIKERVKRKFISILERL